LRSVLDTAELVINGVPTVVLVEPSWYSQAKVIAKSVKLSENRIQVLPLGNVTANSSDSLPIIEERLLEIVDGIVNGLNDSAGPAKVTAPGND
jgi:hypothetical protein